MIWRGDFSAGCTASAYSNDRRADHSQILAYDTVDVATWPRDVLRDETRRSIQDQQRSVRACAGPVRITVRPFRSAVERFPFPRNPRWTISLLVVQYRMCVSKAVACFSDSADQHQISTHVLVRLSWRKCAISPTQVHPQQS